MDFIKIGIFDAEENSIRDYFLAKFSEEVELFNKLLGVYASFLEATNEPVPKFRSQLQT
jgi:hypothetical protein